jgi:hypothetical protein
VIVIVGQFLAGLDMTQGVNPDTPAVNFCLAVRCTTVVDETGSVPGHAAVNVMVIIQRKDIGVLFF